MPDLSQIGLRKVWNACFESMAITNERGDVLDMNRSAMRLFSLSSVFAAPISIFELIADMSLQKYFKPDKEATGIPVSFGTQELVANVLPTHTQSGSLYYLIILKNITQQQKLKYQLQDLHDTKLLYDAVLDEVDQGLSVINHEGKILFYNRKMGEIELKEPSAVKGKRIFEVWPGLTEETSTLLASMKLSKVLNHRETHFTNTGKAVTTLTRTSPLLVGGKKLATIQVLKDISEQKQLAETISHLQNQKPQDDGEPAMSGAANHTRFEFKDIVFVSRDMRQTVEQARRAARSSSNVLIIGETGTGKELFAQSLHNESPRKKEPFIAQNCAALPESLLEGLLFGTSPGSFTGAIDRQGLFEQADGGTLLLDEINSMGLNLQAKLLRVLQEKKSQRLGSAKVVDVDVRIIATMNEDPLEAIRNGHLREDLYYRLSVVNITIPPLRKRKEDIPALIESFIAKHATALGVTVDEIDPDVYQYLLQFNWPGNVRQLEHVIEGCLNLMYDERAITFEHLPHSFKDNMLQNLASSGELAATMSSVPFALGGTLEEQVALLERNLIMKALKESNGNITRAGEKLGLSRQNLNYKLKKYNLQQ
ncbi:UNVERIFIED_CONTAM: arginine utilization regulatory protein [Brevibacillus sp. OAP136]